MAKIEELELRISAVEEKWELDREELRKTMDILDEGDLEHERYLDAEHRYRRLTTQLEWHARDMYMLMSMLCKLRNERQEALLERIAVRLDKASILGGDPSL